MEGAHGDLNDPLRLLKLSHSLRYQLHQPLARRPAGPAQAQQQPAPPPPPPGAVPSPRTDAPPLPAVGARRSQRVQQQLQQQQQQQHWAGMQQSTSSLPPITGPGTRSGPYTGFASTSWLQAEVLQDLDVVRKHVDAFATKREQAAFERERAALTAEMKHLRKRLAEAEQLAIKYENMLPDDNGEFSRLRQEVEELEKEADYFSDLYEREAATVKVAGDGFRQALELVADCEQELDRISQLVNQLPAVGPQMGAAVQQGPYGADAGVVVGGGALGASAPPGATPAPPQADPQGCCGCFGRRRQS